MLAGPQAHAFLGALYGDEPREWQRRARRLRSASRHRQRVYAPALLHAGRRDGLCRKARRRRTPRPGYAPWFAHPHRKSAHVTIVCGHWSTLDLMLAPNVLMLDSGCLWGRDAYGRASRRSPRIPGAGQGSGSSKAFRIARSDASRQLAAMQAARRQRGRRDHFDPQGAVRRKRARTMSRTIVSPDIRRRHRLRAVGRKVAQRDRLHDTFGFDNGLEQSALERQQRRAVGGRAFRKYRDDVATGQDGRDLVVDALRIAQPFAHDENGARTTNEVRHDRPLAELGLGDEAHRQDGSRARRCRARKCDWRRPARCPPPAKVDRECRPRPPACATTSRSSV